MEIDLVPIKDLWKQYSVGKTFFYQLLDELYIEPVKYGTRSYLSGEDKAKLDKYFSLSHPKREQFVREQVGIVQMELTNERIQLTSVESGLIKALAQLNEVIAHLMNQHPTDELQSRRQLKEVAEEGWRLSTSELLGLLMRSSIPPLDEMHSFSRMGFTFTRMGKVGRQYEWRVSKVQP